MKRLYLLIMLALIGGCSLSPAPSPLPSPGLDLIASWHDLGIACGNPSVGVPDNVPQWICQATVRGVSVGLSFEADDASVRDITARVPVNTDKPTAIAVFDDLVSSMSAFQYAHALIIGWINRWSGSPDLVFLDFVHGLASIESDNSWTTLSIARVPMSTLSPPTPVPFSTPR